MKSLGSDYSRNHGYLNALFGILMTYGDSRDLEILEEFQEHPDGIVNLGLLMPFPISKKAEEIVSEIKKQKSERQSNLPWIIAGVLLVNILLFFFKTLKGK